MAWTKPIERLTINHEDFTFNNCQTCCVNILELSDVCKAILEKKILWICYSGGSKPGTVRPFLSINHSLFLESAKSPQNSHLDFFGPFWTYSV